MDTAAERLLEPISLSGQLGNIKAGREGMQRAAEALRRAMGSSRPVRDDWRIRFRDVRRLANKVLFDYPFALCQTRCLR